MDNQFILTVISLNYNSDVIESLKGHDNIQLISIGRNTASDANTLFFNDFNEIKQDDILGEYVYFTCSSHFDDIWREIENVLEKKSSIFKFDMNQKEGKYPVNCLLNINDTLIKKDLIKSPDNIELALNRALIEEGEYYSFPLKTGADYQADFDEKIDLYTHILDSNPDMQNLIIADLKFIEKFENANKKHRSNLSKLLQKIDENNIKSSKVLSDSFKKFLLYLKADDFHHEIRKEKLYLKAGDNVVNGLHGHRIVLDIVDIIRGRLMISGVFKSSCDPKYLDFEADITYSDGRCRKMAASKYEYLKTGRGRVSYLGIDWQYSACFDFEIPFDAKDTFSVDLNVRFSEKGDEMILHPKVLFNSKTCYLSEYCSYMTKKSKIVIFKDNHIDVIDETFSVKSKLELKSILSIIKSGEDNSFYSILIRIIYLIAHPFWAGRRIWLFIDRPAQADDNARHLFSYAIKQDDDVRKYFLIDKSSPDYDKLRKITKNVVALGSLKHKILYLYAEKFISSQTAKTFSNPFTDLNLKLFSNRATAERVFLQHGITIHDVSHWFLKYAYNFVLLVAAADIEKDSIIYPHTNFRDDVVKTLGFPRYDNLSNEHLEKQILFMPTWRKHITDEQTFLNSDYYKMIDEFLNNKDLLEFLKKSGFKIMFKPHFEMSRYMHLIDLPGEVELCGDVEYQELFNKSMLLITDYSSVFFDFAYLKKPVIYYRAGDEYHNKSGYFDFESMGFGQIITSENELIDKIKDYHMNNFEMEEKYKKRVDEFFRFTDKNNSKRVYDCLYEIR